MPSVIHYLQILRITLKQITRKPFFGFIQGQQYLPEGFIKALSDNFTHSSNDTVTQFETKFAKIVGAGDAVSFASGRMGFFALLKVLNIGKGDEVVLLGYTCSVMVNAVLRTGAKPIFSDLDVNTFGSSAEHIRKCLSARTKMIVAQHSFGIPCGINEIVKLARGHKIFLLEDCAISLGSSIDDVVIGNFGDAALFSTDHSKPINTLTGGLIYSCQEALIKSLRQIQDASAELPDEKKKAILRQLILEKKYCKPSAYNKMSAMNLLLKIRSSLFKQTSPFLDNDYGPAEKQVKDYPYPAKLPDFLAEVGLIEISRWENTVNERRFLFQKILAVVRNSTVNQHLPLAYSDPRLKIVPLRFVWTQPDGFILRNGLSHFINIEWTWFMKPIVVTTEPLEQYGYQEGMCPIAEEAGLGMINLPCNLDTEDGDKLVACAQKYLKEEYETVLSN